ncbi:deoxyribodipyrimidine photolyase [Haliangium sp.]|uniref:deoxyribodipyrimidine photolyase n=2 Tax=Haliangium sp. TaxID=2663208 RepID=UPI003D13AAED
MPASRVRLVTDAPVRRERPYVLYWMVAARRTQANFALDRAVDWARVLDKSMLIFEPLRCGYRWASDRLHRFVLDGMADQLERLVRTSATYYPYLEPRPGAGSGLLAALAEHACVVVTDDYPEFFLPRMVAAAGRRVDVRLEAVDGNGLYPIAATDRVFTTAASFRRHLHKSLAPHLDACPRTEPLRRLPRRTATLPAAIVTRWPPLPPEELRRRADTLLARLPIDHAVSVSSVRGGPIAACEVLERFVTHGLARYDSDRRHPDQDVGSGLSPYLHFGHISVHQVFRRLMDRDGWTVDSLAEVPSGRRGGWWGASPEVEAFLDELITWRELGYHTSAKQRDHDRYESLPAWARETLDEHADDPRPHLYSRAALERAETHDPIWNAAQTQLVREGRMHNYLRMLWGKKVLEWSPTAREALAVLIELNNKYALDGRDPNSYSGIFWCLGRYDRAWGPERPIFGKVRYMSSDSTRRKCRLSRYLATYAP